MTLSEKQKEVIRLMRAGWDLYTWADEITGKYGQIVYRATIYELDNGKPTDKGLKTKRIHHNSFISLRAKNIIGPKPFHLTELGKTIEIENPRSKRGFNNKVKL